ncbi:MAG: MarR family transcriptional regulator [Naasia sp.]|uniref:MarR family winged helix-turn-helix transcriptional regulator n=1 Tax=Naasia sp. TaxID=2546198 RepID=UPI00261FFCD4|nr:MarR family winged helix-turn-helix transcriptional regulator [Naasia sp.]MCU1569683.1 MarR family transcriptional regulator [Naasia sp.]
MTDTRNTLASLISSAHRLTRIAAQSTGDQTSPAVWRTLSILAADGPMRLGELARASRVAQPTMTRLVQNLASEDLIRRIADVADSRAWLIATTPKGERALAAWRDRLADAAAPFFVGLSDDDWRSLAAAASIVEQRISDTEAAA